ITGGNAKQQGGGLRHGTGVAIGPNGAFEAGSTAVITTLSPHGFTAGQTVTVSGVGVPEYNGTFLITNVPNANTFTYSLAVAGLPSSGGGAAQLGSPSGVLSLNNVEVTKNTASIGGGLSIQSGQASIVNSTIDNNTAITSGGGIDNGAKLSLTNVT